MMQLLFTLWLNLHLDPCERTIADPSRIVTTVERDGTSVVYDGQLEAFYSTRLASWRYYRTDSPFLDPDSALLAVLHTKLQENDPWLPDVLRPAWCSLPPSRPRA